MPGIAPRALESFRPGLVDYDRALAMQEERRDLIAEGREGDALFLLEHRPVITLGRLADPANVLAPAEELKRKGVILRRINRGGDATFHGPGQAVGYPVLGLAGLGLGVKDYVVALEETIVIMLREDFGIQAEREEGKFTGVWTDAGKLAAIGIGISRGVTIHGFALNVNTDLSYFTLINPCGITDRPVTSMALILGRLVDMGLVMDRLDARIRESFGYA